MSLINNVLTFANGKRWQTHLRQGWGCHWQRAAFLAIRRSARTLAKEVIRLRKELEEMAVRETEATKKMDAVRTKIDLLERYIVERRAEHAQCGIIDATIVGELSVILDMLP